MKILKSLIKILKALNSSQKPWQISLAVVFGMFLGFLPFLNFFSLLIIFLALIININISIFMISAGIFSILAFPLDFLFNKVGFFILTFEPLIPLWTKIYNIPYAQWTNFNNTVVAGSIFISLLLSGPLFIATNKFIRIYRSYIMEFLNRFQILRALKLTNIFEKISGGEK